MAVFDRGPRIAGRSAIRGPLPRTGRAGRRGGWCWWCSSCWWCWSCVVLVVRPGGVRMTRARRGTSPDPWRVRAGPETSAAKAEALDEAAVAVDVHLLQVAEEAAALADEEKQATTAVVVVLVGLEVLGQVLDALREHRDLDLRGTGVALVRGVLGHDALLGGTVEGHGSPCVSLRGAPGHVHPGALVPRPI